MDILKDWTGPAVLTALIGVVGFIVGHYSNRRREQSDWRKDFRELYQQFWDSSEMSEVRAWIACDEGYETIRPILGQRLNGSVTLKDYAVLEKLDRFSALLIRIIHMNKLTVSEKEKALWKELYFNFWLDKIHSHVELNAYMSKCWPPLFDGEQVAKKQLPQKAERPATEN